MSGGKGNGLSHQVLDKIVKFEASQQAKMGELIAKHNSMAAQINAQEAIMKNMAAWIAQELGKAQGTHQGQIRLLRDSIGGMDLNVLALAEVCREMIGQFTQVDTVLKKLHASVEKILIDNRHGDASGRLVELTQEDIKGFRDILALSEAEIDTVKKDAQDWYADLLKASFKIAKDRIDEGLAQEKAAAEAEQAAKEAADKAVVDAEESKVVEAELQNASAAERTVAANVSGGPGSAFPEGAEVWGG